MTSPTRSRLDDVLRRAGAVMVARHGFYVAAHFGSPGGELAVCTRAVGMGDRSDLVKHELRGDPGALARIVGRMTGGRVVAGRALHAAHAWWCGAAPGCVVILSEPDDAAALAAPLAGAVGAEPDAQLTDITNDLAAIVLLGPASRDVLGALGVGEPPREARLHVRFAPAIVGGIPAKLLRESAAHWVILVRHVLAQPLWHVVEQAGEPFGLTAVGAEAMERYALRERAPAPPPTAVTG